MLHRSSLSAQTRTPNRPSKVFLIGKHKRSQKVLKKTQSVQNPGKSRNVVSYFVRIFLSGIIISAVGILFFLFYKNKANTIDFNNSYTILFEKPTSSNQPSVVVSLRGSDKTVNFTPLSSPMLNLRSYFPVDNTVQLSSETALQDKTSFLNAIAPWNKSAHTKLSIENRLRIWQYMFTTDSAHFDEQPASSDPSKLLEIVQKYYSDTALRQLAPTIAVINTTDRKGFGKQVGDILNAWGYSVIQVDSNNEVPKERSELISEQSLIHANSVVRLQLALPQLKVMTDEQTLRQFRSQFVLFIGNDYPVL